MNARRRQPAHPSGAVMALMAVLALGTAAAAQPFDAQIPGRNVPRLVPSDEALARIPIDPALRSLARQLGADDFAEREAASAALRATDHSVRELCAVLAAETMSPEQRFRLLEVIRERLLNTPQGALGISFPRTRIPNAPPGIEVTDTVPGMPAEEVLVRGDRITHIDGRTLFTPEDLQVMVQSRIPGEKIGLTVRRPRRDEQGNYIRDANDDLVYDQLRLEMRLGALETLRAQEERGGPMVARSVISPVRQEEADEIVERFGPRPVTAATAGAAGGPLLMSPEALDALRTSDTEASAVIRNLHTELALVEAGHLALNDRLRTRWDRTLQRLWTAAREPGIPPAEAELRRRIAKRYAELIGRE